MGDPGDDAGTAAERRRIGVGPGDALGLYQLLVESVRDYAIFALDPDGYVLTWNAGAERLKGYAPAEIIGRHFSTFYPAERIAERFPDYELEMAAREGRFEDEGWRLRRDGSRMWASIVLTALRAEDGTLVGYAKVTRDLTERRAAEVRAIEDARRVARAEASSRAKSEFLTAMSHELRTPLNAIGGYAQLMESGVGGEPSELHREYLGRIRTSQQHLLAIITDLLNYGRIEAGQVAYDLRSLPIDAMAASALALMESQAATKRIALERVPCDDALMVRADRVKAEQILLNLLSNAVKFTPPGGRVRVTCRAAPGAVQTTVEDTGPGVAPEDRAAIFEPFVQIGRTLASAHEGTGLGLAISRDLARAMGGDLTVDAAAEGSGARFTLTLPPA